MLSVSFGRKKVGLHGKRIHFAGNDLLRKKLTYNPIICLDEFTYRERAASFWELPPVMNSERVWC